jgi:hypothetical protein
MIDTGGQMTAPIFRSYRTDEEKTSLVSSSQNTKWQFKNQD